MLKRIPAAGFIESIRNPGDGSVGGEDGNILAYPAGNLLAYRASASADAA
jgi:hypothetical protein